MSVQRAAEQGPGKAPASCNHEGKQRRFFLLFGGESHSPPGWIFKGDKEAVRRERDETESVALGRSESLSAQLQHSPGWEGIYSPDVPVFSSCARSKPWTHHYWPALLGQRCPGIPWVGAEQSRVRADTSPGPQHGGL